MIEKAEMTYSIERIHTDRNDPLHELGNLSIVLTGFFTESC